VGFVKSCFRSVFLQGSKFVELEEVLCLCVLCSGCSVVCCAGYVVFYVSVVCFCCAKIVI